MRDLDLIEQEELAKLKSLWRDYGLIFIIGVLVFVGVYGGTRYYDHYKRKQASSAAYLYETYLNNTKQNNREIAVNIAKQINQEYKNTEFAVLVNLQEAKELYRENKPDATTKIAESLNWVITNGKSEITRNTARIQLMQVLIEKEDYQGAIAVSDKAEGETAIFAILELKGDALAKLNKFGEAKAAYEQSLVLDAQNQKNFGQSPRPNPIIAMKIESLPR